MPLRGTGDPRRRGPRRRRRGPHTVHAPGLRGLPHDAAGETPKGPHLGGIATRYSNAELIESIVRPAAKVAQGFATNAFETKDGRVLTGFVIREGNTDVVVRDIAGVETTLEKNIITNRRVLEGSVMPPGLVDTLTIQELASLLAFLGSTTGK